MADFVVRPALECERLDIVALARDFHAAAPAPFVFCPAYVSSVVAHFITAPDALCLVLEVEGGLRGVLAAHVSPSPLAPVSVAQEVIFWIDPAWRGRSAFELLRAYEAWARAQHCAAVGLASLADARVDLLFSRLGFAPVEKNFFKKL